MKFMKSELAPRLAMLKKVIPSKTDIESLKGVLVQDGTLTAYNLNTALRTSVDFADGENFIIPMRAIEMIESMPEGEIEVEAEGDNMVVIKSGKITNRLSTVSADTFPEVDTLDEGTAIKIESSKLQSLVQSIMYAVATTAQRPSVTGMLFDCDGDVLNLVSCDGYRLAWATMDYTTPFKMIVPKLALQTLLSLGLSGKIGIRYSKLRAVFELDNFTFSCRLLEGEYPDYKVMFPKYTDSILIDRRPLLECLRRAVICLEDKSRPLAVMDIDEKGLNITTRSSIGEYSETLPLDPGNEGTNIKIGFNARYLKDCFDSYSGPTLECFFGTSQTPMVVDDGEIKSLVLPVRLSKEAQNE